MYVFDEDRYFSVLYFVDQMEKIVHVRSIVRAPTMM